MSNKTFLLSTLMLAILGSSSSVLANTEELQTQENSAVPSQEFEGYFYLGGRIGWAKFEDSCTKNYEDCDNDTFGYGGYAGYQATDWLGFEVGVTDYGTPEGHYSSGDVETDNLGAEVTAKLDYNLTENLELYTRLGASYLDIDKTISYNNGTKDESGSNRWRALAAVGMEYPLSESVYLRAEYQFVDGIGRSVTDKADLHFTSVGITYRFGQEQEVVPAPIVEPIVEEPVIQTFNFSGGALFATDSAKLNVNAELSELAVHLAEVAGANSVITENTPATISVYGHTDSTGSATYNQKLSERRAQSVADFLVKQGVSSERITAEGMGEVEPIASNATSEGRKQNRRVEITFQSNK